MALSNVLLYSFLGILGFIAASALTDVASPHVVAIWTVISGGVLQVIDAIVEGWLADLCATYQTYFRTSSRHLTRLGVPVTRTVNGTGHTGPSEFCATSI